MADGDQPRVDPLLEVRRRRRGRRPGDAYVQIVRTGEGQFERGVEGELIATARTIDDPSLLRRLRTMFIGRPISSEEEEHERLTKTKALAIFSSDNISSSAYGPEEIMRVLMLAGAAAIGLTLPIALVIIGMLAIVTVSYRQTIKAYPKGASSYIVAGDNLGDLPGVIAAASLLLGYIVTVAVSVSAGVAAITSIWPELHDYRVPAAAALVAVLALGNLRGIRESGSIFMAPTYFYIVAILGVIGVGLFRELTGGLPRFAVPAEWAHEWTLEAAGTQMLMLFIVLRAFSQGAVALTGVEAVSDGVPAFKPPEWRNARITLTWAAVIFAVLFVGISYLAMQSGIVPDPTEQQTVLSLLARHITGEGPYLYVVQIATAMLLVLAANTSFADFPRLSSFLARDGFVPRAFAFRGERLAFTTGILFLAGTAVALIVAFNASVTGLIPLYMLGVFVAFTLSQTGMFVRWRRRHEAGWRRGMVINGLGAFTTAAVALVVGGSNFLAGGWLVMILVPLLVAILMGIRAHYRSVERALQMEEETVALPRTAQKPIVIVPVARLDRAARQAMGFARSVSEEVIAVHITNDADGAEANEMRSRWVEWAGPTAELVVVESPFRALIGPLIAYMDALQKQDPSRPMLVVLSEFVPRHWWENLLHNQTALRLKLRLFLRHNTIVADVPYHLSEAAEAQRSGGRPNR